MDHRSCWARATAPQPSVTSDHSKALEIDHANISRLGEHDRIPINKSLHDDCASLRLAINPCAEHFFLASYSGVIDVLKNVATHSLEQRAKCAFVGDDVIYKNIIAHITFQPCSVQWSLCVRLIGSEIQCVCSRFPSFIAE